MEPAKKKQKVSTTSIFIPHDCWEIILDFLCGTQAVHKDMFQAVIREMNQAEWRDRFVEVVDDLNYLFEGGVFYENNYWNYASALSVYLLEWP